MKTNEGITYYAVRRCKHLRSCIFLNYKDCKDFLEGGGKQVEFKTFDDIEKAVSYLSTRRVLPPKERARSTRYVEWHGKFRLLQSYREKNGHCDVPQKPRTPLSAWVDLQLREYRKIKSFQRSELTPGRMQLLIEEGFNFRKVHTGDPRNNKYVSWKHRLTQLQKYKEKHKHTNVPHTHPKLGSFVTRQRVEYRRWLKGKPCHMTEKKIRELEEVDFLFDKKIGKKIRPNKSWDEAFFDLLQFRDVYGHVSVPPSYPYLGQWVIDQRQAYEEGENEDSGEITQDQVSKLVDIGLFKERKTLCNDEKV